MNMTKDRTKGIVQRIRALGPEFAADADTLEAYLQYSGESRCIIANAGTTNTGKSTLFNALLGREEVFRTADIRETTVCRDAGWGGGIVLTDTPGCGSCSAADDREAAKAYQRADLVVFVHNIATGGMQRDEMDVLKAVMRHMGRKDFRQRTVIVGTRKDACSEAEAQVNRNECLDQVKRELGVDLPFFATSPKRHFRGMKLFAEGKKKDAGVLFAAAGVEDLAKHLRGISGTLGKRGLGRFDSLRQKLKKLCDRARMEFERDAAAVREAQACAEAELAPIRAEIRRLASV